MRRTIGRAEQSGKRCGFRIVQGGRTVSLAKRSVRLLDRIMPAPPRARPVFTAFPPAVRQWLAPIHEQPGEHVSATLVLPRSLAR